MSPFDALVRHGLYARWVETAVAPTVEQVAADLSAPADETRAAWQRLAAEKAIVLRGQTDEILMAHPLSAVDTPFKVHVGDRTYSPNCAWDALGTIAMLGGTGLAEGTCGDCGESLSMEVVDHRLITPPLRIHFAVPARRWWEDIVFT